MDQQAIVAGARQAVVHCAGVQAGEWVVVITDRQAEHLADAIIDQSRQVGASCDKFVMEDLGPRPQDGSSPLVFPKAIEQAYDRAQVSFFIARGMAGELQSFRMPMCRAVESRKIRHAHMIGFTEQMMAQGMASDYEQIRQLSRRVYDIVGPCEQIHVTTPGGTDLYALFDERLEWIISDGTITADQWANLPDGEVFTSPQTANGHVVVDGCLGDYFSEKYGVISHTPLSYELAGGRCIRESVECENDSLKQDFLHYTFETDENANRLGEFAIGTNTGLTELIGNMLQDEKYPGIHLALGSPYPNKTGAQWDSKAHCDGVLRQPTITVDGQVIMQDGTFLI